MKINNLEKFIARINSGKMALGCCITFADPSVTELAAESGFDFCWIDGEHGVMDRFSAMTHIMALRGTDCAPFYRVPACDHTEIKKVIDFAPAGIIVPMIMNSEDAAKAVAACRYPLAGNRGCGYRRGLAYGAGDVGEYLKQAEHDPMVILQIEHIEAWRNLDSILQVPGIGSILIGPYDLSASMGKPGRWDDPEVSAVLDGICRKTREAGIILGVYSECNYAKWKARGVQYISVKNDTGAMMEGFKSAMKAVIDNER